MMARHKNLNWDLPESVATWDQARVACLMDLRDELQTIRDHLFRLVVVLECRNTRSIPGLLRTIAENGHKKKRKRSAGGARR